MAGIALRLVISISASADSARQHRELILNYFRAQKLISSGVGSVRKAHHQAVRKAGILDHFRLYDLRHTLRDAQWQLA
jgi:integrase